MKAGLPVGTGFHTVTVQGLEGPAPETTGSQEGLWKLAKGKTEDFKYASPVVEGNKCDDKAATCHPRSVWEGSMMKTFM